MRLLHYQPMATILQNIDYKQRYEKALSIIDSQQKTIESQQFTIRAQQLEILRLKQYIFGSRHERFTGAGLPAGMPTLFDVPPIAEEIIESTSMVSYQKKTVRLQPNHKGRNGFPDSLRREEQTLYPEGVDMDKADKIGEDVSEVMAYKPCEVYVKRVIRPRLIDKATGRIMQAPAPQRSFEKSNADASLVAQIVVEKYVDHLPLYRQIKRYERLGVTLSDSTIDSWLTTTAQLIEPLYQTHKDLVLGSGYIHADETTIRVQDSNKKGTTHQGYYWVYQSHEKKLVLFDYRTGRSREGPQSILKDYKGYLQTDGYQAYDDFDKQPGIIQVNCMAHARRKFSEALPNDKDRASYALGEIQKLYAVDRHLTDNNIMGEEKRKYRREHAVPVLKEMSSWLKQEYVKVLPASAIGKAIAYSLKRWDKLSLYATTDVLHIDNNPVENSIRPVAVGRKNYLFAGSHAAAQRAAMFYSLLATCKNYNVNPYDWLHDILNRIASHRISHIKELLPQNWKPAGSA